MTTLYIKKLELTLAEPDMLTDVIVKASSFKDSQIVVEPFKRNSVGWLEWHIEVKNSISGRTLTIGAIQRRMGAKTEFCS